jgi:hypothetical protein
MAAMHEALARLGVPANPTVLEPGCGVGHFMEGREGMRFLGVEMDSYSGRIARALHPGQDIRIESFRDTRLPEGRIDAVIGNVPFADLKPGGVLGLDTSHYTLDKQNAAVREYLGAKADFVGAIRLPSDAFKREGTAVVTDIVFLRKRADGEPARHADPEWQAVAPLSIEGADIPINNYYIPHPEMVLGGFGRQRRKGRHHDQGRGGQEPACHFRHERRGGAARLPRPARGGRSAVHRGPLRQA